MLLYRFAFPRDGAVTELYYRANGKVSSSDNFLEIQNGEVLFDTYFNSFSSGKYREYTDLQEIIFTATVGGSGTIALCERGRGRDAELCAERFSYDKPEEISVQCALPEKDGAMLYPIIKTDETCTVGDMGFYAKQRGHAINAALIICTFCREEYVYRNLRRFCMAGLDIPILLVDNGKTIDPEKIDYPNCRIFPNRNCGGSGGFARGMIEALRGGFTHIILMDDDVDVDSVSIQKTLSFIRYLKPDLGTVGIAGGMLERGIPFRQYEASAKWRNGRLTHLKQGLDLRSADALLENEADSGGNYGAWWYLCMPMSALKGGLPFPFFIKTDDVEFGLRTLDKVLVMNGIGLWHDSFEGKFSYHLEYYIKRNELVCSAVHERHTLLPAARKLCLALGKCLVNYNYGCIRYITKAFDDYLMGPDFFLQTDEETLNSKLCSDGERRTEAVGAPIADRPPNDKKLLRVITLNGYLLPSCFLKKEPRAVPWAMGKPKDYFGYQHILELDSDSSLGICRTMERRWLFLCAGLVIKYTAKLLAKNRKAVLGYRSRMGEITSAAFWCRHLGIEQP